MVDRVYKCNLPALRKILERQRADLALLRPKSDWLRQRVDHLLRHARSLETILQSGELSQRSYRLTRGVVFLHSDLVYLRTNVKGLEEVIRREMITHGRQKRDP